MDEFNAEEQSSEVRVAAELWWQAAVTFLQGLGEQALLTVPSSSTWERAAEDLMVRGLTYESLWDPSALARTEMLDGHATLCRALALDAGTREWLGVSRSRFGTWTVRPQDVCLALLPSPTGLGDATFPANWERAERRFGRQNVSAVVLFPLGGVHLDGAPVSLVDNCVLRSMTTEEIKQALQSFVIMPLSGSPVYPIPRNGVPALECVVVTPRHSGEAGEGELTAGDLYTTLDEVAERLDEALALTLPNARRQGRLIHLELPQGDLWTATPATKAWAKPTARITEEDGRRFVDVWEAVPQLDRATAQAVHRFALASTRERHADRLLDWIIAAEAFFTAGETSETGYRLRIHAAHYDLPPSWDRRQVFSLYRSAYAVRSKVAHGDTPKANALRVRGGSVTLDELCAALEEVLRHQLNTAVQGARAGLPSPDWEALVLGP